MTRLIAAYHVELDLTDPAKTFMQEQGQAWSKDYTEQFATEQILEMVATHRPSPANVSVTMEELPAGMESVAEAILERATSDDNEHVNQICHSLAAAANEAVREELVREGLADVGDGEVENLVQLYRRAFLGSFYPPRLK